MKFELVKSSLLSGSQATIYNVLLLDEDDMPLHKNNGTLLDNFIEENIQGYNLEVKSILDRLRIMGKKTGCRTDYFRHFEGKLGDGVCALCDIPDNNLRLYCIRYGTQIVILGGGGMKDVGQWQQDPKLSKEASQMINIAKKLNKAIREKDLEFSDDFMDFIGDLIIELD